MAEIAFLEAKRALADAHAQALRNQYIHNQSVIIENGLGSEGDSEDEEAEKRRKEEEEQRRREEELRKREEEQRRREEEEEERKRIRFLSIWEYICALYEYWDQYIIHY